MEEEVSGYVRTCRLCQQDLVERAKPAGWSPCLYQRDRASVSMDFIASLPKVGEDGPPSKGCTKHEFYAIFTPAPTNSTAEEAAR